MLCLVAASSETGACMCHSDEAPGRRRHRLRHVLQVYCQGTPTKSPRSIMHATRIFSRVSRPMTCSHPLRSQVLRIFPLPGLTYFCPPCGKTDFALLIVAFVAASGLGGRTSTRERDWSQGHEGLCRCCGSGRYSGQQPCRRRR